MALDKSSLLSHLHETYPPELKKLPHTFASISSKTPLAPPDFKQAYKGYTQNPHSYNEVFDNACVHPDVVPALLTGNNLACIDFDNCAFYDARRDLMYVAPKARYMLDKLDCYKEFSSSIFKSEGVGGLHAIGEGNLSQFLKKYPSDKLGDFAWSNDARIDIKYTGGYVIPTGFAIQPELGKLDTDQSWLELDTSKADPHLMIQIQNLKLDTKHVVDIQNRLGKQGANGYRYRDLMSGVHEKHKRYRESGIADLAQAVCRYSTDENYWKERGVEVEPEDKKIMACACANSILNQSDLGWYSSNDESKARVLENAYNKYEVDGRAKSSEVSEKQSEKQRLRSHERNQNEEIENDTKIRDAISKVGSSNISAITVAANLGSRNTVYKFKRRFPEEFDL